MKRLSIEELISKARKIHGDKFDYSKAKYKNSKTKIEIICPIHGSFWQTISNHFTKKYGCNLCSPTRGAPITQELFLKKCISKHGNKFDYSKVVFKGVKNKIIIICPLHGEFKQIAEKHYICGCASCAGNKKLTITQFIKKCSVKHNNYYNYSIVRFKSLNDKIKIICPKHGRFKQIASNHLKGKGCIKCSIGNTSKLEHLWLDLIGIPNDNKHRNVKLKVGNKNFIVDGFIPNSNIIYEFLGDYWHGNPATCDFRKKNKTTKKMFKKLFLDTVSKIRYMRQHGFKVISIWENRFNKKYENISNSGKSFKSK